SACLRKARSSPIIIAIDEPPPDGIKKGQAAAFGERALLAFVAALRSGPLIICWTNGSYSPTLEHVRSHSICNSSAHSRASGNPVLLAETVHQVAVVPAFASLSRG